MIAIDIKMPKSCKECNFKKETEHECICLVAAARNQKLPLSQSELDTRHYKCPLMLIGASQD